MGRVELTEAQKREIDQKLELLRDDLVCHGMAEADTPFAAAAALFLASQWVVIRDLTRAEMRDYLQVIKPFAEALERKVGA